MPKFNDIKKFPHANYAVDIPWVLLVGAIDGYNRDYGLDLNPPYQRGYVWSEYQKTAYVEYQLRGGMSGRDLFFNSPGWPVRVAPIECVDGQQRLKTVLAFLNDEVEVFDGHVFSDYTDHLRMTEARFRFHINNLDTQAEVVEWYLGLNAGGSIHTEEDLQVARDYLKSVS